VLLGAALHARRVPESERASSARRAPLLFVFWRCAAAGLLLVAACRAEDRAFPSNTARGGVLYPILLSLAESAGSKPDDHPAGRQPERDLRR
jgi:di/tricarboxylate transporter